MTSGLSFDRYDVGLNYTSGVNSFRKMETSQRKLSRNSRSLSLLVNAMQIGKTSRPPPGGGGGGGGGTPQKVGRVGACGSLPKSLTLFMTKICDFPYPSYDLSKNLKNIFCEGLLLLVLSSLHTVQLVLSGHPLFSGQLKSPENFSS